MPDAASPNPPRAASRLRQALLRVGVLEWLILAELLALQVRLLSAPDAAAARPYQLRILGCLALGIAATAIFRRYFDGRRWPRLAFNIALMVACLAPFAWLKAMIPIIHPGEVDALLHQWDQMLFGFDASLWLERFASPLSSEWFAAAYFGYYVAGSLMVLYVLLLHRRVEHLCEFAVVILGVNFIGWVLYTLFPGLGPGVYLADRFQAQLPGPHLTPWLLEFVKNGPQRDVFPSMHAALAVGIFLYAARYHRRLAWLVGLWVPHIVVSTVFLRFHYLVDVVVGVLLVLLLFVLARPTLEAWQRLRDRHGVECRG
ncbi:MAG: phosphatase PAP2 family protein [Myxococcales bacterium]|nr:phosphatase PAP2 family protein [Myxococcales bacterium]